MTEQTTDTTTADSRAIPASEVAEHAANAARQPEGHAARDAQPAAEPPPGQEAADARRMAQLEVWQRDQQALDVEAPRTLREQLAAARVMAEANLLPREYRGRPADVLLAWQTADELGLQRMQGLRLLNVVEGTPALGAEGVRAVALGAGHDVYPLDEPEQPVRNSYGVPVSFTVCGQRRGSDRVHRATFTLDDAERAGLCVVIRDENGEATGTRARSQSGKVLPWEAYPAMMLENRATTLLGRRAFPDVLGGLSYTTEELRSERPEPATTAEQVRPPAQPRQDAPRRIVGAGGALAHHAPAAVEQDEAQQPAGVVTDLELHPDGTAVANTNTAARVLAGYCLEQLPGDRRCTREANHDGRHSYSAKLAAELADLEREAHPPQTVELPAEEPAAVEGDQDVVDAELVTEAKLDAEADAQLPATTEEPPAPWPTTAQPADAGASWPDTEQGDPAELELPKPGERSEHDTGTAPATAPREVLWQQLEELAEQRGKTVRQLMMRWTLATRTNPEDATAEQLAAFLQAQA